MNRQININFPASVLFMGTGAYYLFIHLFYLGLLLILIGLLFLFNIVKLKPQKIWQLIISTTLLICVVVYLILRPQRSKEYRQTEIEISKKLRQS